MNYQKIYSSIIENAKKENRIKLRKNQSSYIYYEKHHIIPKCLNGTDEKNNLVLLTAREHYVCHKLLTRIYPNTRGLWLALKRFIFSKKSNLYIATSRDYENIKNTLLTIPSKSRYNIWLEKYGKEEADKREKETIEKIRKTMTGVKYSKERIENAAKGHIGIKLSEKTCLKKKESMKGKNTGSRSKDIKDKISKSMLGKKNAKKYE